MSDQYIPRSGTAKSEDKYIDHNPQQEDIAGLSTSTWLGPQVSHLARTQDEI